MKNRKLNIFSNARLWVVLLVVLIFGAVLSFAAFAEDNDGLDVNKEMLLIDLEGTDNDVRIVITDINSLIEADLALLRWGSMGNSTENKDSKDIVKGVFNGEKTYGYWNVYEKIYAGLLEAPDITTISSPNDVDINWKIAKGETKIVKFSGLNNANVKSTDTCTISGNLIILADTSITLNTSYYGKWCKFEIDGGTMVVQGPRDEKITFKDRANQNAPRTISFINVKEGNLYLNNCCLQNFTFKRLYTSTISFPNGNTERHLYMSHCTMQNVSAHIPDGQKWGSETAGILCMVYNAKKKTITFSDNTKISIIDPDNKNDLADQTALYINNCLFDNCDTNKGGTDNGNAIGGGAIRSYAADRSKLYVYNSTFKNNDCWATGPSSGGGAIYWKSANGEAHLTKCKFEKNSATLVGGAVYNTGIMHINACTFEENRATGSGGAIAVEPPNTSALYAITPTTGSLTLDPETTIKSNTAEVRGGGIYFNACTSIIGNNIVEENGQKINIPNVTTVFEMTLTINGATIENNTARYGGGVAMWLDYDSYEYTTGITIAEGSTIKNNVATGEGGAIWMNSDPDCACDKNGGVTMNGGTLEYNTAPLGGAVYIGVGRSTAPMAFNMTGGTARFNGIKQTGEAVTSDGGAIYMTRGTCTLSGGTITDCRATGNGGGVYLGGGNLIVSGCTLTGNKAENGAGAYVKASNTSEEGVTVHSGAITGNIAQQNGGGIAVNNGFYKMAGGSVDGNRAENGHGGGVYVSATQNVVVEIRSGSVSSNYAGESGAAVAVVGPDNGSAITITVTVGVNEAHFDANGKIDCDHNFDGMQTKITDCPVLSNNTAFQTGGAVYITGGEQTVLNTYCLVEKDNHAADGKTDNNGQPDVSKASMSDFMMVEGGTVTITTANETGVGDTFGKIEIPDTIHVKAGDLSLDGSMSNPLISGEITVDVTAENGSANGSFMDNRDRVEDSNSGKKQYYTIQYFENFTDPTDGTTTGRYTVINVEANTEHVISATLYEHSGYMIDRWWTKENAEDPDAQSFQPGEKLTADKDYQLYAKWLPNGYWVYFDPGVNGYSGTEMPTDTRFTKDVASTLPKNTYFVPGMIFVGWDADGNEEFDFADEATVINLTTERSITLVAVWTPCTHGAELFVTYTTTANSVTRTCTCQRCSQTATIIAKDTTYNGQPQGATLEVTSKSENGVDTTVVWNPQFTHTGTKIDSQDQPIVFGTDAGYYTASITEGGKTVTVTYTIAKATQTAPPTPTYTTVSVDGKTSVIINEQGIPTDRLQYRISYYKEGDTTPTNTIKDYDAIVSFGLDQDWTTYYISARYEGDDNHIETVWVMAKAKLVYDGNISIFVDPGEGINFDIVRVDSPRSLIIDFGPQDGYYLYDTKIEQSNTGNKGALKITDNTPTAHWSRKVLVSGIPESSDTPVEYTITIIGAKLETTVTPYVGESEIFGEVSSKSATIKRDSAYTAYFEVNNFDSGVYDASTLSLKFSTSLPAKATIIMVDKTTATPAYYYYVVDDSVTTIPLKAFTSMLTGNTDFSVPAGVTLKYQFIVDFSDCELHLAGDSIQTFLTADCKQGEAEKGVPAFPHYQTTTNLEDSYTASLSVLTDTQVKVAYPSTTDTTASKWIDRAGVLVLIPQSTIPTDARISVTDGSWHEQFRPNANGEFFIPISKYGEDVAFTLISDFFPIGGANYTFGVQLISACSSTALSPKNGTVLADGVTVTFLISARTEPAISITPIDESGAVIQSNIYDYGSDVRLQVAIQYKPAGTELVLRLLNKNEKGVYLDAGWSKTVTEINDPHAVPLGRLTGSCCIVLELRNNDAGNDVIMSAYYYFVIRE